MDNKPNHHRSISGYDYSDATDRRRSHISRLSITSDMISEDQIHNNEIFSPRPVLHSRSRVSINAYVETVEENCYEERISLVPDGDIDTLFSTDETCGKTADELFDYGISMFDVFSSIRSFVDRYPYSQQDPHSNVLPPKAPNVPKYTLVLDLDGTVVNCSLKEPSYYDDSFINETYDETTQQTERCTVFVQYRPYVFHFLEVMNKYYEIIVFTASTESYAKHLVDIFNKDEKIVQYCLAREYTTFVNDQEHFKDLRILNRDLEKTFILDNTPLVYSYNVNNAVPISTYKGGKDDKELFALIPFFQKTYKCRGYSHSDSRHIPVGKIVE